ncbi:SOS response-associated peptidase [Desulfocurvibacter africanus]|uniref:SOS response-associated peptidase n=1 Tax=Desulfocurvibacter africanus TaxID=873 RepID=UPI000411A044|nr:SOS response-associated peptidase [Desulfocurvibacter africanus]
MCGRFALAIPRTRLEEHFRVELPELPGRYNIAPGQDVLAVIVEPDDSGRRQGRLFRWGLVPFWAKDAKIGNKLVNARIESAADKPAFRSAFARRRCIIPAQGFYEWRKAGRESVPYFYELTTGEPMGLAGLWESWHPQQGDTLFTCVILTCPANELVAQVHERMPVVLRREDYEVWLAQAAPGPELAASLALPRRPEEFSARRVSPKVNTPRSDGPELLSPWPPV